MDVKFIGFLVFGAIIISTMLVGAYASRKVKTSEDYWVGGRNLGTLVTIGTQAATFIGGGMTVGWISMGYKLGYGAFWYGIPQCLGIFLAGYFLVKPFRSSSYTSLPDFFNHVYGNDKKVNLVMTAVSLLAPVTWVAGQFSAAGRIMEGILGIKFEVAVVIAAVIVIAYAIFGGFLSVAYTDAYQFAWLFVLFMIVAPMPIIQLGGLGAIAEQAPEWMLNPLHLEGMSSIAIPIWIFMGLTESLGLQTLYQRIYSAKTDRIAGNGLKVTGWLTVLWGVLTPLVGMAIYIMNPSLNPDNAFSWFLGARTNQLISMGFLACVVMATISTADSMLNSVALNIGYDIYQRHINPKASEKKAVRVGQAITLIFGIISIYWAMQGGLIQAFFGYASSVSGGPLVAAVFVTAFAKKRRSAKGIVYGVVSGAVVGVICIFAPVVKDILAGGVMFSFLTTVVVALALGGGSKDGNKEIANDTSKKEVGETSPGSVMKMALCALAPFNYNGR